MAQSHLNCITQSVREQLTQEITTLRIVAARASAFFVTASSFACAQVPSSAAQKDVTHKTARLQLVATPAEDAEWDGSPLSGSPQMMRQNPGEHWGRDRGHASQEATQ
jgi:hypothetical protein